MINRMSRAIRISQYLSILFGGLVVGLVIGSRGITDSLIDPSASFTSAESIGSGVLLLAVVGVLAAALSSRAPDVALAPVAVVALAVLAADTVLDGLLAWTRPVASGVLTGVLAVRAGTDMRAQTGLLLAVFGAGIFGTRLDDVLTLDNMARTDYATSGYDYFEQASSTREIVFLVLAAASAILLVVSRSATVAAAQRVDARTVAVGVALPIIGSALSWLSSANRSEAALWYVAFAALVAAAVIASFVLRDRDGAVILALFAAAGASIAIGYSTVTSAADFAIVVAFFVVGGIVAARWPHVYVGLGLLAATALSALVGGVTAGVASTFVFPFAVAYTAVAVLPVASGALAVSVFVPFTLTVSVTVAFASAGSAGLIAIESFTGSSNPPRSALALCGAGAVLACAAGIAAIGRRTRPEPAGPDAAGPDATGPDATGPDAAGPDAPGA